MRASLAPERIARLASCALQSSSTCPRVPPPLDWRVQFRRDLQRSHTPRYIAISCDRTAATAPRRAAPHRSHPRPLPTRRSSLAVPARAHVPVYAVLPLSAHLDVPAPCPAPLHRARPRQRHHPDRGPGRLQGLVRLKVARAGRTSGTVRRRGKHAATHLQTWQRGRLRTTDPVLVWWRTSSTR